MPSEVSLGIIISSSSSDSPFTWIWRAMGWSSNLNLGPRLFNNMPGFNTTKQQLILNKSGKNIFFIDADVVCHVLRPGNIWLNWKYFWLLTTKSWNHQRVETWIHQQVRLTWLVIVHPALLSLVDYWLVMLRWSWPLFAMYKELRRKKYKWLCF